MKNKVRRFRFDHMPGDTAWQRLIVWLHRRRIRHFAVLAAFVCITTLCIFVPLLFDAESKDMSFLLSYFAISLVLGACHLVWIIYPYKDPQVQKIIQLGDAETLAEHLEEDLAREDGVLFQKRGVYVTDRFIIDTAWYFFHLYPIEGLLHYDSSAQTPVFYYENGVQFKVETNVPFKQLKPYIDLKGVESKGSGAIGKSSKISVLYWVILIFMIILIGFFSISGTGAVKYMPWLIPVGSVLFFLSAMVYFILKQIIRNRKMNRIIAEIEDVDQRIDKTEELYQRGYFTSSDLYYNWLSTLYYEKGDYEKALWLIREAKEDSYKQTTVIRFGSAVSAMEIYQANEINYLIALKRLDEAARLLDQFDDSQYKNANFLYLIRTSRARLALEQGNIKMARHYVDQIDVAALKSTPEQRANTLYALLLLQTECDLAEGDTVSALPKLDEIINKCGFLFTVKRASELKSRIVLGEDETVYNIYLRR